MNQLQKADPELPDVDDWYFDAKAEPAPTHGLSHDRSHAHVVVDLDTPPFDRHVIFGCTFVGMIGFTILLAVVAGSSSDLTMMAQLHT